MAQGCSSLFSLRTLLVVLNETTIAIYLFILLTIYSTVTYLGFVNLKLGGVGLRA